MARSRGKHTLLAPLLLAMTTVAGSGCAILELGSGGVSGGDATLSGAAEAAADTSRKKRDEPPADAGYHTPPSVEPAVVVEGGAQGLAPGAAASPTPPPPPPPPDPFRRPVFGIAFEYGALGGGLYDPYGGFALSGGGYLGDRWRLDAFLRASDVNFTDESLAGSAFQEVIDLKFDLMLRYELTKGWTFLSLYPVVGLGTGTLFWDYATPVPVIQDGAEVLLHDDQLNHFYGYAGFGFAAMRTRHVLLDVIGTGGVRWYGWHTKQGLDNDLLPATGTVQVQFELAFR